MNDDAMKHCSVCARILLVCIFIACAPGALSAQTKTPPQGAAAAAPTASARPVTGALENYFSADSEAPAVRALHGAKLAFNRLLVAEVLPGGKTLLAEVALSNKDAAIRYPIKLERDETPSGDAWRVTWAPDVAFAQALVAACEANKLAALQVGRPWEDFHRLPAFPVIVTREYVVTPFGKIDEKPDARAEAPAGALHPSKELTRHVQRWTGQVMLDDPASANVDLLLHADVTWKHATQALMAPAMQGLFRIYFVGHGPRGLYAVSAAAPVFKEAAAATNSSAVIAMSALPTPKVGGDVPGYAFRVRLGDQVLDGKPAAAGTPSQAPKNAELESREGGAHPDAAAAIDCAAAATFCARTLDDFRARLKQRVLAAADGQKASADGHKAVPTQVLLAAPGDLPAMVVVNHLGSLRETLEMTTDRIFAGYSAATE